MGRAVREVLPNVAVGIEPQLRHVIDTGKPILGGTVEAKTPARNQKDNSAQLQSPLRDEASAKHGTLAHIRIDVVAVPEPATVGLLRLVTPTR